MPLQIQLSVPNRNLSCFLFSQAEKLANKSLCYPGNTGAVTGAAGELQMMPARPASPIPLSKGKEPVIAAVLLAKVTRPEQQLLGKQLGVHRVGRQKMREHPGTVDSLPFKGMVGKGVGFTPGHLLGHEIFDTAFTHQLRQDGAETEGIGQPEIVHLYSEFFLKEALSVVDLANQRFPGGDVAVRLHPHGSQGFPAACFDRLLDLREELGVTLLDQLIQLGLAGGEPVLRILLHTAKRRGKGTPRFADGFA